MAVAAIAGGVDGTTNPAQALRRAKFSIPPGPERAVARPELVARFLATNGAKDAPVTIVSAPTGAGKTALAAAAARAYAPAAAWCTVDASDNQPHTFGLSV